MRHLCVLVFFFGAINLIGFSQTEIDKTIFKIVELNQIETVILNVRQYDVNAIGALKDGLLAFDEKVLSVTINEELNLFSFTYNDKMLLEDLVQVFEKHSINYLLNPKGSKMKTKTEGL